MTGFGDQMPEVADLSDLQKQDRCPRDRPADPSQGKSVKGSVGVYKHYFFTKEKRVS
jgi:hypothetical protein